MSNSLTVFPTLTSGSLRSYLKSVASIPILSKDEEEILIYKYKQENDLEAAKNLMFSHLRFVVYLSKNYSGYGLPVEDLIQEGTIGLMKAIKKFDISYKVRLISFAAHWIKAEIHNYIMKNWQIVKIATTRAHRKLFFNFRKNKKHLGLLSSSEAYDLAKKLEVSVKDVKEMEDRFKNTSVSLYAPIGGNEQEPATMEDFIKDKTFNPEESYSYQEEKNNRSKLIKKVITSLDVRSQDIITSRWLNEEKKTTLRELAGKYQVSIERIRQIEERIMEKIKLSFL